MADRNDGAIYVGVLPDLRGFDTKLREQARKSGLKFGNEFADTFDAALGPKMRDDVRKAVTTATKAAPPVQVKTALDTTEAQTKLQSFTAQKAEVAAKVTASTKQAQVDIDRLTKQQAKLQVKVDANDSEAKAKVDALEERKVAIQAKVDANTAGAIAKLAELDRRIGDLDKKPEIKVRADTSAADTSIGDLIRKTDRAIGSAGGLGVALSAIGPAALPSLAAAAAGVVALGAAVGGAAAVSVGTGLLAFSGLGDAVKALDDQQTQASRTSAQAANATSQLASKHLAAAGAADQLKQAEAGLANAQANAADASRAAAQRVEDAEDGLRSAQDRARQAQLDLTDARKAAAQQLEDLNTRLKDSALSEEEATLRVAQAKERLEKARTSGTTGTELQEAELALRRAKLTAEEQAKDTIRLRQEKADADAAGVEGSNRVRDAAQRVTDANRAVEKSTQSVTDANNQVKETERRNAYQIAQAKQAIVAANRSIQSSALNLQKVAVPAVDKLKEAMDNLSPAGQKFARFLHSLKPGLDELKGTAQAGLFPGLEQAIKNLTPLMPILKQGIGEVARAMGDAAVEVSKALVSPEGRTFLKQLFKDAPGTIRSLGTLAAAAARALATIFIEAGPAGKELLRTVITDLTAFLKRLSTPEGKKSLKDFFDRGVEALKGFGTALGGAGSLLGALLGTGNKPGEKNALADSLRAIGGALRGVGDFIREHPEAPKYLAGIGVALAGLNVLRPLLGPLKAVVGFFGEEGLGGILARTAIGPALEGIGTALAALGPIGWLVAAVLAVMTADFILTYNASETFRDIVNGAFRAVGDVLKFVWEHVIHPVIIAFKVAVDVAWAAIQVTFGLIQIGLKILGAAWQGLYSEYIKPVWDDKIQPLLDKFGNFLDEHVIPKIRTAAAVIGGIFGSLAGLWKKGFSDAIELVNKLLDVYNRLAKTFGVKPDDVHVDNPFKGQQQSSLDLSHSGGGGGRIPTKAAAGGLILGPGTGTSDSIPAQLSNGEFVLRAGAVRVLGAPFLHALNRADGYRGPGGGGGRYAGGGLVGDLTGAIADPAGFLGRQAKALFKALPNLGLLNGILNAIPGKLIGGMVEALSSLFGGAVGNSKITGSPAILALGQQMAAAHGWTGAEWSALEQLWQHESGWNPRADNPTSTAFGIPQFLASTARGYGLSPGDTNPAHQIAAGLRYISAAYGDPINAWSKWQSRSPHWYDSGGWLMPGATMAMNGTGKPEKVLTHDQWTTVEKRGRSVHIDINYPPHVPPEVALVDAQARADLLNY